MLLQKVIADDAGRSGGDYRLKVRRVVLSRPQQSTQLHITQLPNMSVLCNNLKYLQCGCTVISKVKFEATAECVF